MVKFFGNGWILLLKIYYKNGSLLLVGSASFFVDFIFNQAVSIMVKLGRSSQATFLAILLGKEKDSDFSQ